MSHVYNVVIQSINFQTQFRFYLAFITTVDRIICIVGRTTAKLFPGRGKDVSEIPVRICVCISNDREPERPSNFFPSIV